MNNEYVMEFIVSSGPLKLTCTSQTYASVIIP